MQDHLLSVSVVNSYSTALKAETDSPMLSRIQMHHTQEEATPLLERLRSPPFKIQPNRTELLKEGDNSHYTFKMARTRAIAWTFLECWTLHWDCLHKISIRLWLPRSRQ